MAKQVWATPLTKCGYFEVDEKLFLIQYTQNVCANH